ncbi:MAG: cell division protein SepF [Bifidobacteriaceae bacterium]|jgi:cell division inhibitor SepF|nr:cell division protein SepF [Bifidobacteriaceae bacterium]
MPKNSAFKGIKKLFEPSPEYGDDSNYETLELANQEYIIEESAQPRSMTTDKRGNRITVIHPVSYNDAPLVGEPYRNGVPVIMNLSKLDSKDAKRFVDFAVGLAFGLYGHLEKVTEAVFLLSPQATAVESPEELSDTGDFFATSN